ncbi:MAG: oligosaccharide flippase family protein [Sphingomonadales bacterium]|nr:oligosaccharide flippase family protein [Sphingomonadales bacterium]
MSIYDIFVAVSTMLIHIICAIITPTIWALVYGGIISSAVAMAGSFFIVSGVNHKFVFSVPFAKEIMHFGKWILLSTMVYFLSMNFDQTLSGTKLAVPNPRDLRRRAIARRCYQPAHGTDRQPDHLSDGAAAGHSEEYFEKSLHGVARRCCSGGCTCFRCLWRRPTSSCSCSMMIVTRLRRLCCRCSLLASGSRSCAPSANPCCWVLVAHLGARQIWLSWFGLPSVFRSASCTLVLQVLSASWLRQTWSNMSRFWLRSSASIFRLSDRMP